MEDRLQEVPAGWAVAAVQHIRNYLQPKLLCNVACCSESFAMSMLRRCTGLQVCRQLLAMVPGPGLGPALIASEVATALKVPVPIAAEHLQTAEAASVLCRDDGPEGLRYFRNFFKDAHFQALST